MKSRYRIYLIHDNNKIIDFAVYDSLYEFITNHVTIDVINYSFFINEKLYHYFVSLKKENDYFYRNYSLKDFIAKFGLEEMLV